MPKQLGCRGVTWKRGCDVILGQHTILRWYIARILQIWYMYLLVFSVTPFKIDKKQQQQKRCNKTVQIDKVRNLGNERRLIYQVPRQDSGLKNIPYTR